MKVNDLVKVAEESVDKELQDYAVGRIKDFQKSLRSAKKVVSDIEVAYNDFLALDVADLEYEFEGFEW